MEKHERWGQVGRGREAAGSGAPGDAEAGKATQPVNPFASFTARRSKAGARAPGKQSARSSGTQLPLPLTLGAAIHEVSAPSLSGSSYAQKAEVGK